MGKKCRSVIVDFSKKIEYSDSTIWKKMTPIVKSVNEIIPNLKFKIKLNCCNEKILRDKLIIKLKYIDNEVKIKII